MKLLVPIAVALAAVDCSMALPESPKYVRGGDDEAEVDPSLNNENKRELFHHGYYGPEDNKKHESESGYYKPKRKYKKEPTDSVSAKREMGTSDATQQEHWIRHFTHDSICLSSLSLTAYTRGKIN